jgi:hypothetical protein
LGGGWWAGYHYCGGWTYQYRYAPTAATSSAVVNSRLLWSQEPGPGARIG